MWGFTGNFVSHRMVAQVKVIVENNVRLSEKKWKKNKRRKQDKEETEEEEEQDEEERHPLDDYTE